MIKRTKKTVTSEHLEVTCGELTLTAEVSNGELQSLAILLMNKGTICFFHGNDVAECAAAIDSKITELQEIRSELADMMEEFGGTGDTQHLYK